MRLAESACSTRGTPTVPFQTFMRSSRFSPEHGATGCQSPALRHGAETKHPVNFFLWLDFKTSLMDVISIKTLDILISLIKKNSSPRWFARTPHQISPAQGHACSRTRLHGMCALNHGNLLITTCRCSHFSLHECKAIISKGKWRMPEKVPRQKRNHRLTTYNCYLSLYYILLVNFK